MSKLRLNGSTSGYTEIDAPAVAGSNTLTLPTGAGSANQFLKNGATAGDLAFGTTTEDASGNLAFNSGYGSAAVAYGCRAWVNFHGVGTVAIRASGNVSSITDNGLGDYTVNFTTAMVDANYAYSLSLTYPTTTREAVMQVQTVSAASIRVLIGYSYTSPGASDVASVAVAIFR